MTDSAADLPDGVIARIDIYDEGVRVGLRYGMPKWAFAQMLRDIADAYDDPEGDAGAVN